MPKYLPVLLLLLSVVARAAETANIPAAVDQEAVALAKDAAGERYVNVLGAATARACLEIGELDEVLVFIAPVMLGGGVRLFDRAGGEPVRLERTYVGGDAALATTLWFRVLR